MKKLYANEIIEDNGVTHGVVGLNETVQENLNIILGQEKTNKLNHIIKTAPKNPFYFFSRFC